MARQTVGKKDREKLEPLELRRELSGEYAGYEICDPEGNKLGKVEEVFVNDARQPEYIRVKLGLLWTKYALIPVQSVAVHEEHEVLVLE